MPVVSSTSSAWGELISMWLPISLPHSTLSSSSLEATRATWLEPGRRRNTSIWKMLRSGPARLSSSSLIFCGSLKSWKSLFQRWRISVSTAWDVSMDRFLEYFSSSRRLLRVMEKATATVSTLVTRAVTRKSLECRVWNQAKGRKVMGTRVPGQAPPGCASGRP